jgi:hypothetical protein
MSQPFQAVTFNAAIMDKLLFLSEIMYFHFLALFAICYKPVMNIEYN